MLFLPQGIARVGASTLRRVILRLSVGWLPPSVRPSGACLTRGTRLLSKPPHALFRRYFFQFFSRRTKITKQIPVNTLTGVERPVVQVKVLTRFDRQDERSELVTNTVQNLDETVILSL